MRKKRVAIATDGNIVAEHFGRCATYTLVDIEDNKEIDRKVIENPGHEPGAIPKLLNSHNADFIVSGGMGQRAQMFFADFGIEPILGIEGDINEVINQFLQDNLKSGESLCSPGDGKGQGLEKTVCDNPDENSDLPANKECSHHETNNMKIAITSQGPTLDSGFDERFGRCQYFVIVDTKTDTFEGVHNDNISASGGAGTASAKKIADLGVQAVISGHFGPNAVIALQALGIKMHTNKNTVVREALAEFKNNTLPTIETATVEKKSGL
jgi:predicted Fe-Mo cluster-binding NifX family protein